MASLGRWEIDSRYVDSWLSTLPEFVAPRVLGALDQLQHRGPSLGRPLVDTISGSQIHNLKELRPVTNRNHQLRILFVFSPRQLIVLLAAGDKRGSWRGWYREHIHIAEKNYEEYRTLD